MESLTTSQFRMSLEDVGEFGEYGRFRRHAGNLVSYDIGRGRDVDCWEVDWIVHHERSLKTAEGAAAG